MKQKFTLLILLLFIFSITNAQTPELWCGMSNGGSQSFGSIIKINGDGSNFTTAFNFDGTTGSFPGGHLVLGSNHLFYGTAFQGGYNNDGAIFSFDPNANTYTDLYDLDNENATWVNSDLVFTNDTSLFGITYNGGAIQKGNIFRFNPTTKKYYVVYEFNDTTIGSLPRNIMLANDNKLYGTADLGGIFNKGVIFSFDPSNNSYTDVHDFDSVGGTYSCGGLFQASNNRIYGMCAYGGTKDSGVVYSFNPSNKAFTKVHDFNGLDGSPAWNNGLTEAANGQVYGLTLIGGTHGNGVIFKIDTTSNQFTKVHDLTYNNGTEAIGKMITASDGNLYGLTTFGGAHALGTLFRFETAKDTFIKLKDLTTASGGSGYGYLTELPAATGLALLNPRNNSFILYPNPAVDQLIIGHLPLANSFSQIGISDLTGRSYPVKNLSHESSTVTLDISGLSAGIYFVEFYLANGKEVRKFVKE